MDRANKFALFGFIFLYFVFLLSPQAFSASLFGDNFPYSGLQLRLPTQPTPFPGLGNYYSAAASGIETLLWNPAGLSRMKGTETIFSSATEAPPFSYSKRYTVSDQTLATGISTINLGIYFTSDKSVSQVADRQFTGNMVASQKSSGQFIGEGMKINDNLFLGFTSQSDAGFNLNLSGNYPILSKMSANFNGSSFAIGSNASLRINSNGYPTVTMTAEGITYTKTIDTKLWNGFLNQSSVIPMTSIIESQNDISVKSGVTLAGAGKWNSLSVGLSVTPFTAQANIFNNAKLIVDNNTPDMYLYQPNIGKDEQSILNWIQDPNQAGTEVGYKRSTILVPSGQTIAEAKYQGFYQADLLRTDLGATYDLNDNFCVGLVFENLNGAAFNFTGKNRLAYVNTRVSSFEMPSIDPSREFNWNLFSDIYTPVSGTENWGLEETFNVAIPKRMRVGLSIKKPLLIVLDYEQNQSPINYKYSDNGVAKTGTVSNINLIRLGIESRLFNLPIVFRDGLTLMLKPTLNNFDSSTVSSVDSLFRFGVLPLGLDTAIDINLWSTVVGISGGFNFSPLISLAQLDTNNLDLSKLYYYDLYASNGPWQINYKNTLDPISSAGAYNNRDANVSVSGIGYLSFARCVQTLSIGYKF